MQAALFTLTGMSSYSSKHTGLMHRGKSKRLPYFLRYALPPVFDVKLDGLYACPLCFQGGLGDKIYGLPALYEFQGKVGISHVDEPLYRVVADKVRLHNPEFDTNAFHSLRDNGYDLSGQIAEFLGVELKFRLPVLKTTPAEKRSVIIQDNFLMFCDDASNPERRWEGASQAAEALSKLLRVVKVKEKLPKLFPLLEAANCCVSVETSLMPMSGAVQIPLVVMTAPDRRRDFLALDRIADFLDACTVEPNIEAIVGAVKDQLAKKHLSCWCGHHEDECKIVANVRIKICKWCGTARQDVKLSEAGLLDFYFRYYDDGWSKVVEGKIPHSQRLETDKFLAASRLAEWGIKGTGDWLDVGAGNGALGNVLRNKGWRVHEIDPANLLGENTITWNKAGQYDYLSFVDSLQHIMFPAEALEQASSHLKQDGRIVIEFPVAQEDPRHYRRLVHLFFFTDVTIRRLIKHCGFKVERLATPIPGKRFIIIKKESAI